MRILTSKFVVVLIIALLVFSCKSPLRLTDSGSAVLTIHLAIPSPDIRPVGGSGSRALDPATGEVRLLLSSPGLPDIEATAMVSGSPPTATLSVEVIFGRSYTLTIDAFRTGESDSYARYSTTRVFSRDSGSLNALLLPLSTIPLSPGYSVPISGLAGKTVFTEATLPQAGAWTISLDRQQAATRWTAPAWYGTAAVGSWLPGTRVSVM